MSVNIRKGDVHPARVLSEDDDFMILEIGKHDGVSFTLDEDTPDRFYTLLFAKSDGMGGLRIWNPFKGE